MRQSSAGWGGMCAPIGPRWPTIALGSARLVRWDSVSGFSSTGSVGWAGRPALVHPLRQMPRLRVVEDVAHFITALVHGLLESLRKGFATPFQVARFCVGDIALMRVGPKRIHVLD